VREPTPRRLYLLLDYGNYWDFAKGHVEAGEDDLAAARRELREETGITRIELIEGFSREITYFFRGKKGLVRKSVIFFLARAANADIILSEEHVGWAWLEYKSALGRVNFANAKDVLRAAHEYGPDHDGAALNPTPAS
jgi:8-oxo-dGTP pyrophosphatase MutT (NUDIX family)